MLALLCLLSLLLSVVLNHPYRPFPTDELWSYSYALQGNDWLASRSEILLNSPLHIYSLLAVKPIVELLGLHWFQTFLVTAALALNGTALLLGLTVQAATGRTLFAACASLLFIVSAWSQAYLHFYTHAPIACLFMMASLYCFTRHYLADRGSPWLAGATGLCAGLFFLSSSSAKLLAGILILAYSLLLMRSPAPGKKANCLWLTVAASIPIFGFMPIYLEPLQSHLRTNISAGNGIDCLDKYGFLPETPFFSFFHLLGVYSPPLLVFLLASLAIAALQWKRLLQMGRAGSLALTLLGIVLLHSVALDLLPFTKLGRSHFPVFPLTITALSLMYATLQSGRGLAKWLFLAFILTAIPLEVATSTRTWQARREAPAQLDRLPSGTALAVLQEDPHHEFIAGWLAYSEVYTISRVDIPQVVQALTTPLVLIIGPTGPNSGKSILRHSIMDDFYFALPPDIGTMPKMVKKLPYYAHYPLFMMEEENSQCFFFRHQVPDPADPRSQLTVYFWPGKAGA